MIIRGKAPLRIGFGGGGTDISPYPEERGGMTLSTTIDMYTYATLVPRKDKQITAKSLDYDTVINYHADSDTEYNGELDLVKAATKVMKIEAGCELFLHSDSPVGSGLGTSSALVVALIGVLKHWKNIPLTLYETAELAYYIERVELQIKGGKQDQYAATFGGFNFIEYTGTRTIVNPLRIREDILNELEYRLLLCYTGKRKLNAGIIEEQVSNYKQGRKEVVKSLDEVKELAIAMKNAILLGQIDEFGHLLHEGWRCKKKFSTKITDPKIDELYEVARKNGAIGGKLLGAGGGGYLLLLCEFDKRHVVAEQLTRLGGKVTSPSFNFSGLQTWEVGKR
jgi:D-glycero-alpha-D-manno-heptose-7-phosphate kinase